MITISLFIFYTCLIIYPLFINAERTYYLAATVEYHAIPQNAYPPEVTVNKNVDNYVDILGTIKSKTKGETLDVVVFSESSIDYHFHIDHHFDALTWIPAAEEKIIPCHSTDPKHKLYLKKLSCAARNNSIYLVVNMIEKSNCVPGEGCFDQEGTFNIYNTDVVFDRNGTVISRYRKINLFGEPVNVTKIPHPVNFTTDFGVNFGVFTCFDLLFVTPSLQLAREGVKHFLSPANWFSTLPFYSSLQAQQAFSYGNDVVLLSAGANYPKRSAGGSGIYNGKQGPLTLNITAQNETVILISKVPKTVGDSGNHPYSINKTTMLVADTDRLAKEMDDFLTIKSDTSDMKYLPLDLNRSINIAQICDDSENSKLCCNFVIKTTFKEDNKNHSKSYKYLMAARMGVESFNNVINGGVEICAVLGCLNDSINSCGFRFSNYSEVTWPLTFDFIKIEANFTTDSTKFQNPNSVLSSLRPVSPTSTIWSSETFGTGVVQRTYILKTPQSRLLTFGIVGRDTSKDIKYS